MVDSHYLDIHGILFKTQGAFITILGTLKKVSETGYYECFK